MGRAVHPDPRHRRPWRDAAQKRRARGAARSRLLHLHQPGVVPAAAGRCAGSVSAVRESGFGREVTRPLPDPRGDDEPPGLPGLRSWRAVYLLVLGWFALVVVLLTAFTRFFS